jgi:hypothetical protein
MLKADKILGIQVKQEVEEEEVIFPDYTNIC